MYIGAPLNKRAVILGDVYIEVSLHRVAEVLLIMLSWLSATEMTMVKITSSSRTLGLLPGENKDTSELHQINVAS